MNDNEAVSGRDKLELYTDAFESFEKTIGRLESSYAELEDRFSALNSRLEETNERLRLALDEKERARSFLNNVLSSVSSAILVYDRDGRITMYNSAAEKFFGLGDSLRGKYGEELIVESTRPEISAEATLKSGKEFSSEEKILMRMDGSEVPVAVSTSLMTDQHEDVIGVVEVLHDLTKIRALEDEVSRVKALAALGEIAATVAHEVRNPLGGIVGFASLLKRDLPEDHEGQRMVDKIIRGVENLDKSVSSLLMYARDVTLSCREVDIRKFINEITTYFSVDMNRETGKYDIETTSEPDDITWRLDPEQFRHAVVNLLQNAAQAMPDGGTVRLAISADDMLHVAVEDQGRGIPEEVRNRIFAPFFTTKQGGTGLGLATVKKIVEAHRGTVEAESLGNGGARFTLSLPR